MTQESQPPAMTREELKEATKSLLKTYELNPPLSCEVVYFPIDKAPIKTLDLWFYVQLAADSLRRLDPKMSFEGLNRVVFAQDYTGVIKKIASAGNHASPTDEGGLLGVAMAVRTDDGMQLVFSSSIVIALQSEEITVDFDPHQLLRHELCHIADNQMYSPESLWASAKLRQGVGEKLLCFAKELWAEYYANRYSVDSDEYLHSDIKRLASAIQEATSSLTWAKLRYMLDNNYPVFDETVQKKARLIFISFGYFWGSLAATGRSIDSCPDAKSLLLESGLLASFNTACSTLQKLDEARPWPAVENLAELYPVVESVLAVLGVAYFIAPDDTQVRLKIV